MNTIKSFLLVITLLASLFFIMPSVQAEPSVLVSSYELTPSILMPGDEAILTVTITNAETTASETVVATGSGTTITTVGSEGVEIDGVSLTTITSAGFRMYSTESYSDIGYLAPGTSVSIPFKIIADIGMPQGTYFPKVRIDTRNEEDALIPVVVRVSNLSLDVEPHHFPRMISNGGTTDISLSLINKRNAAFNSVVISPICENNTMISPSTYYLSSIDAYSSTDVTFSIEPTITGIQNINFAITYYNGDNLHSSYLNTSTEVIEILDVSSIIYQLPKSLQTNTEGVVRLEVYNAKSEGITAVTVVPITDLEIVPSQYFIGEMNPDDVFSASFTIDPSQAALGNHTLSFKVTFKQDNDYYETPLNNNVLSITEPAMPTTDYTLPIFSGIVVLCIIILVAFQFIRKKGRKP